MDAKFVVVGLLAFNGTLLEVWKRRNHIDLFRASLKDSLDAY